MWEVISFKLAVAVNQWAARLDGGEGNPIPVSVLFASPRSEFGPCPVGWHQQPAVPAASEPTVLPSIDTEESKQGDVLEVSLH